MHDFYFTSVKSDSERFSYCVKLQRNASYSRWSNTCLNFCVWGFSNFASTSPGCSLLRNLRGGIEGNWLVRFMQRAFAVRMLSAPQQPPHTCTGSSRREEPQTGHPPLRVPSPAPSKLAPSLHPLASRSPRAANVCM